MLQNIDKLYVELRIQGYGHNFWQAHLIVAQALAGTHSDCGGLRGRSLWEKEKWI